jgi:hypothetical protein
MKRTQLTIQTLGGQATIDATAQYEDAKRGFLADYGDDPAVVDTVYRNGDLAELGYLEAVKGLSVEGCAAATVEEINTCLRSCARLALCHLAMGYKRHAA